MSSLEDLPLSLDFSHVYPITMCLRPMWFIFYHIVFDTYDAVLLTVTVGLAFMNIKHILKLIS